MGGKAGTGGVDLCGKACGYFSQRDGGANHVIVGAGDRAAAIVEGDADRPGVAGDRRAGQFDGLRPGLHRIRRQRRRGRSDGEGGRKRVAGGVDDDQRHAGRARGEVACRIGIDRFGQRRADLFQCLAGQDEMAEFLHGSGDVERNRPGRAGLRRAAEDDRAGGLGRPRRFEGHGVAGDDRGEVGRDAVGQVGRQVGDALARGVVADGGCAG